MPRVLVGSYLHTLKPKESGLNNRTSLMPLLRVVVNIPNWRILRWQLKFRAWQLLWISFQVPELGTEPAVSVRYRRCAPNHSAPMRCDRAQQVPQQRMECPLTEPSTPRQSSSGQAQPAHSASPHTISLRQYPGPPCRHALALSPHPPSPICLYCSALPLPLSLPLLLDRNDH